MTLERVAELVRRAAADTGVVDALRDHPGRLRSLLHLTPADLQSLNAPTTTPRRRTVHEGGSTAPTAGSGTLFPPEGSGQATGVALSGITSATTSVVPQPPAQPPPGPPPPPVQPPPVAVPPPTQPPEAWPPPPPSAWPPQPPPAEQPQSAPVPPAYAAAPCGCPGLAELSLLSTLSTTAITAITAIVATSRNQGVSRPEEGGTDV